MKFWKVANCFWPEAIEAPVFQLVTNMVLLTHVVVEPWDVLVADIDPAFWRDFKTQGRLAIWDSNC